MKKAFHGMLLAFSLLIAFPLGAQTATTDTTAPPITAPPIPAQTAPEPYQTTEFPTWANSIRRSEIVAFGSLPFTVFFATFAMDSYRYYQNDWDRLYAPWPLKAAGAIEMDESQRFSCFVFGCVTAIVIGVVDYALVTAKQRKLEKAAQNKKNPSIMIERKDWPPIVELPSPETP